MRIPIAIGAVIYVLFAVSCFRLAWIYGDDRGLSIGEGLFTLLGGVTLVGVLFAPRWRAPLVFAGTVPLAGWFIATPYNSGPPFLVASLIAPAIAGLGGAVELRRAVGLRRGS
jgi:hypothetical protein